MADQPEELQDFQVGDTTYKFPKSFTDDQVKGVLMRQGVIPGASTPAKSATPQPSALEAGIHDIAGSVIPGLNALVHKGGDAINRTFGLPRIIGNQDVQDSMRMKFPSNGKPAPLGPPKAGQQTSDWKAGGRSGAEQLGAQVVPTLLSLASKNRPGAGGVEQAITGAAQQGALGVGETDDIQQGRDQAAVALGISGLVAGAKSVAPPVAALANKIYKSALLRGGGDKADKIIAADVAPELVKRGFTAITEGGLSRKVQDNWQTAGTAVGQVEDDILRNAAWTTQRAPVGTATVNMTPPGKVDFRPVVTDYMKAMQDKLMVGGRVAPGMEGEAKAWVNILKGMQAYGKEPSFENAIKLRRTWDATVAEANGFQRPDLAPAKEAMRTAANSIRAELSRAYPELAKVNSEYSFWSNVNKVVENTAQRVTGHGFGTVGPLAALGTVGAGLAAGKNHEAVIAGMVVGAIDQLAKSTAARTMQPMLLDKLSKALASGNYEQMLKTLALVSGPSGEPNRPAPQLTKGK